MAILGHDGKKLPPKKSALLRRQLKQWWFGLPDWLKPVIVLSVLFFGSGGIIGIFVKRADDKPSVPAAQPPNPSPKPLFMERFDLNFFERWFPYGFRILQKEEQEYVSLYPKAPNWTISSRDISIVPQTNDLLLVKFSNSFLFVSNIVFTNYMTSRSVPNRTNEIFRIGGGVEVYGLSPSIYFWILDNSPVRPIYLIGVRNRLPQGPVDLSKPPPP